MVCVVKCAERVEARAVKTICYFVLSGTDSAEVSAIRSKRYDAFVLAVKEHAYQRAGVFRHSDLGSAVRRFNILIILDISGVERKFLSGYSGEAELIRQSRDRLFAPDDLYAEVSEQIAPFELCPYAYR